jgi:hypothetical protein
VTAPAQRKRPTTDPCLPPEGRSGNLLTDRELAAGGTVAEPLEVLAATDKPYEAIALSSPGSIRGARREHRLDDPGRGLSVGGEAVVDLFEVLHGTDVGSHDVTVLAGDAPALDDLHRALGKFADLAKLFRRRT